MLALIFIWTPDSLKHRRAATSFCLQVVQFHVCVCVCVIPRIYTEESLVSS